MGTARAQSLADRALLPIIRAVATAAEARQAAAGTAHVRPTQLGRRPTHVAVAMEPTCLEVSAPVEVFHSPRHRQAPITQAAHIRRSMEAGAPAHRQELSRGQ